MEIIPGAAYLTPDGGEVLTGDSSEPGILRDCDGVPQYPREGLIRLYTPGDDVRVQYLPDGKTLTAITHEEVSRDV